MSSRKNARNVRRGKGRVRTQHLRVPSGALCQVRQVRGAKHSARFASRIRFRPPEPSLAIPARHSHVTVAVTPGTHAQGPIARLTPTRYRMRPGAQGGDRWIGLEQATRMARGDMAWPCAHVLWAGAAGRRPVGRCMACLADRAWPAWARSHGPARAHDLDSVGWPRIKWSRCGTRRTARELAWRRDARAAPRHARVAHTDARERFGGTRRAGMGGDVRRAMPSRPARVTSLLHHRLGTGRGRDMPPWLSRPRPISLAAILSLSLEKAGPGPEEREKERKKERERDRDTE